MTDQVRWDGETRTEVSKLVVSTNELSAQVRRLLDAITGNFDDLILQLTEATTSVNGGVADLSTVKNEIEESIRQAQEDMGNVYQSFLYDSAGIKGTLAGLAGDTTSIQAALLQMSNSSTILTDKFDRLNIMSDDTRSLLTMYTSQVANLQQSVSTVDQKIATVTSELNNVSSMTQLNQSYVGEFLTILNTLYADVATLEASVNSYTQVSTDLVNNYNAIYAIATEASNLSQQASADVATAIAGTSALTGQYAELNVLANTVKSSIDNYNATVTGIAEQLSNTGADVNTLTSNLDAFTIDFQAKTSSFGNQIVDLNIKLSALDIKADELSVKLDETATTIIDLNNTVAITLQTAMDTIQSAQIQSNSMTSAVADADIKLAMYTNVLSTAKADTDLIFNNLAQYKADVNTTYNNAVGQIGTLDSKIVALDYHIDTATTQFTDISTNVQAASEHIDAQAALVDGLVNQATTIYLPKTDKAADSALLDGHAASYFLNEANAESKLDSSTVIGQLRTDISNINSLLVSDSGSLDTLQEIVDFIETNKQTLDSLSIAGISGLQTALDGKLGVDANAVSATKWSTGRKITLTGAISGDVTLDGSSDVNLVTSLAGSLINSYTDVPGLVGQLELKLDKTGTAPNSLSLGGVSADRFFYGVGTTNVKSVPNLAGIDSVAQSGFYETADLNNYNAIYQYRDVDSSSRIVTDYLGKKIFVNFKTAGVWDGVDYTLLTDSSNVDFAKVINAPEFATRANTWDEVTGKPVDYLAKAHTHPWTEVTGKPLTFPSDPHTHPWSNITDRPTTWIPSPHDHYSAISQGDISALQTTTRPTYSGVSTVGINNNGYPILQGNTVDLRGSSDGQLAVGYSVSGSPEMYVRVRGNGDSEVWSSWSQAYTTTNKPTASDVKARADSWVPAWVDITNTPTTLAGYGITDALSPTGTIANAQSAASADEAIKLTTSRNLAATGDATWSVSFDGSVDVTSALTLAASGVAAGTYTKLTVDAKGRATAGEALSATDIPDLPWSKITDRPTTLAGYGITDAASSSSSLTVPRNIAVTGDATWSVTFDGSADVTSALTLAASGVAAGTYTKLTVDAKGRATAGTTLAAADIPALDWSKITTGKPTTLAGYGITDAAASSHVGATGTAHGVATTSVAGFMSNTDKTKLDGVAAGANLYVHPTGDGNLHVPATAGVGTGLVLSTTSTAGVLQWVSSIWRSYGVSRIARSSNNSNLYVNQYTKVMTITLTSQYSDYTTELTAMSNGSGTANNQVSRLNIRVKQQPAFGNNPFMEMIQTQLTPVDRQRYFYSVVQNTPTSIVDIYMMNCESWSQEDFFIQNDSTNGSVVSYLSTQSYTDTLPANAVEFVKGRMYTDQYHPLADAWTTARTITWTGDVTGAATFNGSANVSNALSLATTGVAAGTYTKVTVDTKGRVSGGTTLVANDIPSLDWSKITTNKPTTLAGYGITDAANFATSITIGASLNTGSNACIEVGGIAGTATTPFIDFHSGAVATDYDARIIASGGNGNSGAGALTVHAGAGVTFSGPVTSTTFNGTATAATKWATPRALSFTGDATGSMTVDGSAAASAALTLAASGVAAGTYTKLTVDAKGRATAGTTLAAADIPALDWSKITTGKPTTLAGYGITDGVSNYHIKGSTTVHDSYTWSDSSVAIKVGVLAVLDNAGNYGTLLLNGYARSWDNGYSVNCFTLAISSRGGISVGGDVDAPLNFKIYRLVDNTYEVWFTPATTFHSIKADVSAYGTGATSIPFGTVSGTPTGTLVWDGLTSSDIRITAANIGSYSALSATKWATARALSFTGDATGSMTVDGSAAASAALTLAASGVAAGTYTKLTVDAKGRATAGTTLAAADIPALDWSKITTGKPTTLASYGITDAQAALGFTPVQQGTGTSQTANTVRIGWSAVSKLYLQVDATNFADVWPISITGNAATSTTATKWATPRALSFTGDATGSMTVDGSAAASAALTLAASGVAAGTYTKLTVDAKGRATAGTTLAAADIPALDWSKITTGKPTTLAGYGITDAAPSGYGLGTAPFAARGSINVLRYNGWQEYNGDAGDTDGPVPYGTVLHVGHRDNAVNYTGWASQLFLGTNGGLYFRATVAPGSFAGAPWQQAYSTGNKPTPADIGAIGVNTGNVLNNASFGVGFLSLNDSSASWIASYFGKNAGVNQVVVGELTGRATIGAHTSAKNAWAPIYINHSNDGAGARTYISQPYAIESSTTLYRMYHEGFKPTAADVGALALAGNAVSASRWATARTLTFTGEATGAITVDGSAAASAALSLSSTGIVSGTYTKLTVDSKGRATAGALLTTADIGAVALTGSTMTGALGISMNNASACVLAGANETDGWTWIKLGKAAQASQGHFAWNTLSVEGHAANAFHFRPQGTKSDLAVSSGAVTVAPDTYLEFLPNSTWGAKLRVGGNGRTASNDGITASMTTTNGNLHLDGASGAAATYLSYYAGTGGVKFGNGAGAIVGSTDSTGNLSMNGNISAQGSVIAGDSASSAYVNINSAAGFNAVLYGRRGTTKRWGVYVGDSSTEAGSNTGGNFRIFRFKDDGSTIGSALDINRATGLVNVVGDMTVGGTLNASVASVTIWSGSSTGVALTALTTGLYLVNFKVASTQTVVLPIYIGAENLTAAAASAIPAYSVKDATWAMQASYTPSATVAYSGTLTVSSGPGGTIVKIMKVSS